jgi:hypothetical protein
MNRMPPAILVLAIIGIVFAALGILGALFGAVVLFFPFFTDPSLDALRHDPIYITATSITLVFGTLTTILLLAASLGSLKLRPWARKAMLLYALLALAQNLLGTLFNLLYTLPHMTIASPGSPAARAGFIGGVIGGLFGLLFNAAWSICILYFFSRPSAIDAFNPAFIPTAAPTPFPVETPEFPPAPPL